MQAFGSLDSHRFGPSFHGQEAWGGRNSTRFTSPIERKERLVRQSSGTAAHRQGLLRTSATAESLLPELHPRLPASLSGPRYPTEDSSLLRVSAQPTRLDVRASPISARGLDGASSKTRPSNGKANRKESIGSPSDRKAHGSVIRHPIPLPSGGYPGFWRGDLHLLDRRGQTREGLFRSSERSRAASRRIVSEIREQVFSALRAVVNLGGFLLPVQSRSPSGCGP